MQGDRSVGRMMRHRRGDASSFLTPPMTPPSPFNPAFVTMKFQTIWNGNGKISCEDKDWADLSDEQKEAATALGMDEDEW